MKPTRLDPGAKSRARYSTFKVPRAAMKRKCRRVTDTERGEAAAFKASVFNQPCAVCGIPWTSPDPHHVIPKQMLKRMGLPLYDPRNALPTCPIGSTTGNACHELHENGRRRIPRAALSEANLNYASEVLGERAGSYLARTYA